MLRRTGSVIYQRIIPLGESFNLSRRLLIKGRSSGDGLHLGGQCFIIRNPSGSKFLSSSAKVLPRFGRAFSSTSESKIRSGTEGQRISEHEAGETTTTVESIGAEGSNEVEYTLQLTEEEMQEVTRDDPELIKKVKYIQLEHEVYRQEGMKVPSKIKLKHWKELLYMETRNGRRKYYNFLWLNEMKMDNDKIKKQQLREERYKDCPMPPRREEDPDGLIYGLSRNTIFLRLYDTTVNKFYNNKMVSAMMHSRPLVIDCGFDEFMTPREAKNCAKQLEITLTNNKTHTQPFNIYLCNANPNSKIMDYLQRIIPTIYTDAYPLHVTEKSYTDIFPQKELVYLSPHSRDVLEEYNEDEVYIVGAMVDKSDPRPFSLAKAKKENIRMKKLPLDNHLMWGLGTKSLTINQMGNILLDLRYTKDWSAALKHVPRRKLQREFHPYPNDNQQDITQPPRRESKSRVLEDFELMNQRKGYRKSDNNYGSHRPNKFQYDNDRGRNYQDQQRGRRNIRYDNE